MNCQHCGGKIGLFTYGHTAEEHFCSAKCQMAKHTKNMEKIAKEALREAPVCGPCSGGDHENCELVECDCK